MGSRGLDAIVEWAISAEGVWSRKGLVTFPTLRVGQEGPGVNSTRGSWRVPFGPTCSPPQVNGRSLSDGSVTSVRIGPTLRVEIAHDEGLAATASAAREIRNSPHSSPVSGRSPEPSGSQMSAHGAISTLSSQGSPKTLIGGLQGSK